MNKLPQLRIVQSLQCFEVQVSPWSHPSPQSLGAGDSRQVQRGTVVKTTARRDGWWRFLNHEYWECKQNTARHQSEAILVGE